VSARVRAAAAPQRADARSSAFPREVRIVGGAWKRSKLPVADRPGLRPTPDRVRETLFNWLGQSLDGEYPQEFIERYPDLKGLVKVLPDPLLRTPS